MTPTPFSKRWARWAAVTVAVIAVVAVAGPFVYIRYIEGPPPAPFALSTPADAPSAPASAGGATSERTAADPELAVTDAVDSSVPAGGVLDGSWTAGAGSAAGYRVDESLLGQSTTTVGRTHSVMGHVEVEASAMVAASFVVDLTQVTSDQTLRDEAFRNTIMQTSTYPTATFTLTTPIVLPDAGAGTVMVEGELTLHGVSRLVEFEISGQLNGDAIEVVGSIPVTFADYGIELPSVPSVTIDDHGLIEFLLVLVRDDVS